MQVGSYTHLLSGAAPGLDCAACLHVDDITREISVEAFIGLADSFFEEIGEAPQRVAFEPMVEGKARCATVSEFRKRVRKAGHFIGRTMRSVTVSSGGYEGNAISATWTPRACASVALHARILEIFLQTPNDGEKERAFLQEISGELVGSNFACAYVFSYPHVFSPLAYASGISYSPGESSYGSPTFRDSERIANWANHCYRGHRASEGFLRDVYPLNVIGDTQLMAKVGDEQLKEWIEQDCRRGRLLPFRDKTLWSVEPVDLPLVQASLDKAKILLAGFPPP